jgi:hypothetical protein
VFVAAALGLAACGPRAPAQPAPLAPSNVLDAQPPGGPPSQAATDHAGGFRISGTIEISPALAGGVTPGVMFIVARAADEHGAATGAIFAVDKILYEGGPVTFTLTEDQAMVTGQVVPPEAVLYVRYDQDADAMSKQPGDLVGQTRTVVPATNVRVVLDQRLP